MVGSDSSLGGTLVTKAKPVKATKGSKPSIKPLKEKPAKARPVESVLSEYRELVQTRLKMAEQVYDYQDSVTQEVLDRIRDRLRIASTGVVLVNGNPYKLEQDYVDFNLLFLACEILSDLALMGIKIANFKPHPMWCAECKRKITGTGTEPKRKRNARAK